MVLEALIDPRRAKQHPLWLFAFGILFSSVAVIFSLWVFKSQASLIMVFLTAIMAVPLMYATLITEENEDIILHNERSILKEHSKALTFLSTLFLGFVVGYSLLYLLLPSHLVQATFNVQLETINTINANLKGNIIDWELGWNSFFSVMTNNFKVFLFCIVFAFFFGAGSLFILAWNASVISAAVGTYFRNSLADYAATLGYSKLALYFNLFTISILRYMIHGIFEIVAYFLGGLAGGIISVALLKHGVGSKKFNLVVYNSLILILIAFLFILVGSLVEVFITPLLF